MILYLLSIFQQRCKQQKINSFSLSSQLFVCVQRIHLFYFHEEEEHDEYHDNDDLVLIIMFTVYSDNDGCMMSREEELVVPAMKQVKLMFVL